MLSGCELSFSCSSTAASLENSWSRELFERAGLSSVLGEPDGSAAAGAEAACQGEGCGVERVVASGGLLATGVTRCCCCCDAGPLSFAPFSFSFSFSLASLALEEEPPILRPPCVFGEIEPTYELALRFDALSLRALYDAALSPLTGTRNCRPPASCAYLREGALVRFRDISVTDTLRVGATDLRARV